MISVWFADIRESSFVFDVPCKALVAAPLGKTEDVIVVSVVSQLNSLIVCRVLSVAKSPKVVFIVSNFVFVDAVLTNAAAKGTPRLKI